MPSFEVRFEIRGERHSMVVAAEDEHEAIWWVKRGAGQDTAIVSTRCVEA